MPNNQRVTSEPGKACTCVAVIQTQDCAVIAYYRRKISRLYLLQAQDFAAIFITGKISRQYLLQAQNFVAIFITGARFRGYIYYRRKISRLYLL